MEIRIKDKTEGGWIINYFGKQKTGKGGLIIKTKEELVYQVNRILFKELQTERVELKKN